MTTFAYDKGYAIAQLDTIASDLEFAIDKDNCLATRHNIAVTTADTYHRPMQAPFNIQPHLTLQACETNGMGEIERKMYGLREWQHPEVEV